MYYNLIPLMNKTPAILPAAQTYFDQVVTNGGSLTNNEKTYINTFIGALGTDFAEFDRLWIHGLSNSIAARTSLANPTSTMITEVNSPTFTANQGYTGNGTTSYLNSNYNTSIDGVKFTRNNCSYGGYFTLNIDAAKVEMGASNSGGGASDGTFIEVKRGGIIYANANGNYATQSVLDSRGFTSAWRNNSLNFNIAKNGVSLNYTAASTALVNKSIYILNWNEVVSGYLSSQRIALSYFGSSTINQSTFYTKIQALGTSIGWAV